MRTERSWRTVLGVLTVLIAGTALGANPPPRLPAGPISAGIWTGYFETGASITNVMSGVTIYAKSEGKGDLNLTIDSQGNVTGVIGPYHAEMEWGAVELGGKTQCSWTAVADVSSGTVTLNAAGLPVFSLQLKLRPNESSYVCTPPLAGTKLPSWDSLGLEASTFSGGKMTGIKVETSQPADEAFASMASLGADISRHSYWELNSSSASVDNIKPEYEQYFLENITLQNTYSALIDWHDNSPGTVHFALAGQWQDVAGEPEVSAVFNVGQVPAGTNPLEVTAITSAGQTSAPLTYDVLIVPLEPWAEKAYLSVAEKVQQVPQNFVLYRGTTQVPQKPIVLPYLDLSGIPVLGKFLGKWGVPPFQVDVNLEATSLGGLSNAAPVTGTGGLYLGGNKPSVPMTVTGEAFTNMTQTALLFDHGQANFKIDPAIVERTVGLVDLIPAAAELYGLPVFGDVIKTANTALGVTIQLTASGTGKATLAVRPDQSELYFNTGSISPVIGITGKPSIGIPKILWGAVGVTGKGKFTIEIAPNPSLTSCAVTLNATAHVVVIGLLDKIYNSPDYVIAQCASTSWNGEPALAVYLPDEFARRLRSHVQAIPVPEEGSPESSRPSSSAGDDVLAEGAMPQAELDLALGPDGRMAFAFTPGNPAGVSLRLFDGQAWGEPVDLSGSTALAFSPSVAFNPDGNAVVVWVQSEHAGDLQDLVHMAKTWEVAYAVVQPNGTVSAKGLLTQDQVLDFGPRLARGRDGSLWLAWIKSPSIDLWGPAEEPNQLWAARWQSDGWSKPELVTDRLVGSLSFALAALDRETALIVADTDFDSNAATVADRDLLVFQRDTGGWGSAQRLTNDDALDAFPVAAYDSGGSPVVAWLRNGEVVGLEGNLGSEAEAWKVAPPGTGVDLAGGELIAGADGRLELLWSGFTPQGLGIWLARRANKDAAWDPPTALVDGTAGIGLLSGAAGPNNDLWVGYSRLVFAAAAGDSPALPTSSSLIVTRVAEGAPPANSIGGLGPGAGAVARVPLALAAVGVGIAVVVAVAILLLRRRRPGR